jgi:YkoY family integral membrane protein
MTFSGFFDDGATVLTLVVLEALLSGDNALVLAVMVRHLPESERGRALRFGLLGAFIFRGLAVLAAGVLIRFWQLKALGAAYLIFLFLKYVWRRLRHLTGAQATPKVPASFWKTVFWIEVVDLAFSLDSIMAAVGMSSKIYIVYLGGILGIVSVRFIAGYVVKLLERLPALETSAYTIVGWIGVKLGLESWHMAHGAEEPSAMPKWLFWSVMLLIFGAGLVFKRNPGSAS